MGNALVNHYFNNLYTNYKSFYISELFSFNEIFNVFNTTHTI